MAINTVSPRLGCERSLGAGLTLGVFLFASGAAQAAADTVSVASTSVGEIVVTAQKRSEVITKVPMAVSALTGDALNERGYDTIYDFDGAIANVSVIQNVGDPYIEIRGVFPLDTQPGSDPSVTFHVNGIFLAHPEDTGGSFYDISRIEVLKGPQGTLYGRDAIGGVVNVITNRPIDKFEASELLTVGNYQTVDSRTVLSGPLAPNLFVRIAVATDNHRGYSLNLFDNKYYDDQNAKSGRFTLVFLPRSNVTMTTIADWHREDDGNYATHLGGIVNPAFPLQGVLSGGTSIPLDANGIAINPRILDDYSIPTNKRESWGIAEEVSWRLSNVITINSLSAYRHVTYFYGSDFYGTTWPFQSDYPGFDYVQHGTFQQISQELQLVGTLPRLNWILGAFYLDDVTESGGYSFGLSPDPFPFPFTASGSLKKRTYAVFGQATYRVTDRLGLTLGLRYSHESNLVNNQWTSGGVVLSGFGPCTTLPGGNCAREASVAYHSFTPRVEVHYQWTDGLMTYASFAEGYKSGGFQIETLSPPFLPSTVRSYEIGAKEVTADHRLSVTAAIFHSDYTNMQVNEVSNGFTTIVNAARSRIDGAEVELAVKPFSSLTILDAAAYLDGRYLSFMEINPNFPFLGPPGIVDEAGHVLQEESKYTNNLRVTYKLPLGVHDVRAAIEWNWRSKMYFSEFNDRFELQPAYSLVNASLRYTGPSGKWYVEGFIKNITNSLIVSQESIGGCGCINSQYFPPRTYGVNLSYQY